MDQQTAKKKFEELNKRKIARAVSSKIAGFRSVKDNTANFSLSKIAGNDWTRLLFEGPFYCSSPIGGKMPLVTAVFVQSKNGNTDTESGNPGDLGGGETDLHLVYEGLSRIDADAVMAGANTIRGSGIVFGVWHPELSKIRRQIEPNFIFPAQIIVSASGNLDLDNDLIFNLPDIQVYIITTDKGAESLANRPGAHRRGWVRVISTGSTIDFRTAFQNLSRSAEINKISVVGGRTTVSELFDQGLISDLYLTTSPVECGKPNTPFYVGKKGLPPSRLVLKKEGLGKEKGVIFEHLVFENK